MKNNLFSFATSELSQDAFICWCLNWINYPNENLYSMAKDIFSNLLEEENIRNIKVEIKRQFRKTDILVLLKDFNKAYIIEDKTYSSEHNEQIKKYKEDIETIKKELKIRIVKTVYFKTGFWFSDDDSVLADIKINRKEFLDILNKYKGKNPILDDYCEYFYGVTEQEEKEKNYLISQEEFKNNNYWYWNMSKSAISQYQFIKEIFSKGYIRSGRSIGGGVYTQYDILKDKVFPDTKGEDLSENKRKYSVFWRIDTKNKIGVYISLNFYTEHNKGDVKPRCREDEYNKLKDKIKKIIDDNCSNLQITECRFYNYWEPNLLIIPLKEYLVSKSECDKLISYIRIISQKLKEE